MTTVCFKINEGVSFLLFLFVFPIFGYSAACIAWAIYLVKKKKIPFK